MSHEMSFIGQGFDVSRLSGCQGGRTREQGVQLRDAGSMEYVETHREDARNSSMEVDPLGCVCCSRSYDTRVFGRCHWPTARRRCPEGGAPSRSWDCMPCAAYYG